MQMKLDPKRLKKQAISVSITENDSPLWQACKESDTTIKISFVFEGEHINWESILNQLSKLGFNELEICHMMEQFIHIVHKAYFAKHIVI